MVFPMFSPFLSSGFSSFFMKSLFFRLGKGPIRPIASFLLPYIFLIISCWTNKQTNRPRKCHLGSFPSSDYEPSRLHESPTLAYI